MTSTPDIAVDCACELGEGPTWDAHRQRLLWLDIDAQILHELADDGHHCATSVEQRVTAVVPDAHGGLIAATGGSVNRMDDVGRIGSLVAALPLEGEGLTNDGRCDPFGRFWIGTVDRSGAKRAGLFCVTEAGSVTRIRNEVSLSNGLDWSPDGRVCHYVDSFAHRIDNIHLDADGFPVRSETLVEIESTPDGLTVDVEGGVWVALWDGGAVHRYTPDGRLDRVVSVPGGFITSCAFGGPQSTTLFITTARVGLSDAELRTLPHAGALFALDVGVAGRGYTPFG